MQDRLLEWLRGEGSSVDQSRDGKNSTVLRRDDFTEPFPVPHPLFDGSATSPLPPCADSEGKLLPIAQRNARPWTFPGCSDGVHTRAPLGCGRPKLLRHERGR